MANETMITVQGWVGNAPVLRKVGDAAVLNFRVGCTPRHYDKSTDSWVDSETQWYSVSAWRRLAAHGARSFNRGDAVIVHGRVNHRAYRTSSGGEGVSIEIEAFSMGHDLNRGIAQFHKAPPASDTGTPAPASPGPAPDIAPEAHHEAGAA